MKLTKTHFEALEWIDRGKPIRLFTEDGKKKERCAACFELLQFGLVAPGYRELQPNGQTALERHRSEDAEGWILVSEAAEELGIPLKQFDSFANQHGILTRPHPNHGRRKQARLSDVRRVKQRLDSFGDNPNEDEKEDTQSRIEAARREKEKDRDLSEG